MKWLDLKLLTFGGVGRWWRLWELSISFQGCCSFLFFPFISLSLWPSRFLSLHLLGTLSARSLESPLPFVKTSAVLCRRCYQLMTQWPKRTLTLCYRHCPRTWTTTLRRSLWRLCGWWRTRSRWWGKFMMQFMFFFLPFTSSFYFSLKLNQVTNQTGNEQHHKIIATMAR